MDYVPSRQIKVPLIDSLIVAVFQSGWVIFLLLHEVIREYTGRPVAWETCATLAIAAILLSSLSQLNSMLVCIQQVAAHCQGALVFFFRSAFSQALIVPAVDFKTFKVAENASKMSLLKLISFVENHADFKYPSCPLLQHTHPTVKNHKTTQIILMRKPH